MTTPDPITLIPGMPAELANRILSRRERIPAGMTMSVTPPEPAQDGSQLPQNAPEQPDGVSDVEWQALGDPGKTALVRERVRATNAERDLAALRAAQKPKPSPPAPKPDPAPEAPKADDMAALITAAVEAAVAPLRQAQETRDAQDAARAVVDAVAAAAEGRFIDPSDALTIDLQTVVGDDGKADAGKVKTALDDLLKAKPHLAKPAGDTRRRPGTDAMLGGQPNASEGDRVKQALARMQTAAGIKLPAA